MARKGGCCWKELRTTLNKMVSGNSAPDALVMHFGENDLVREKELAIMKEIKDNRKEIGRKW